MEPERGVQIPPEQLSPEALQSLVEEFVTRDGTELTDANTKVAQVKELLRRGEVEIWFDATTGTCNILRS